MRNNLRQNKQKDYSSNMRVNSYLVNLIAFWFFLLAYYFYKNYFNHINDPTMTTRKVVLLWIAQILLTVAGLAIFTLKKQVLKYKVQLVLASLGILLALVSLEVSLRIIDIRLPKFTPHQYLSYFLTPNYRSVDSRDQYNSIGFRGPEIITPKPNEIYRIAILGGSSAFDSSVQDWRKDSARILESELRKHYQTDNIEVINAATPGWNSWEDLVNFEFRVLDLEPDLILIYQGVNDVHARLVKPSAYKGDDSGRRRVWEKKPCNLLCLKIVQRLADTEPELTTTDAKETYSPTPDNNYNKTLGMTSLEALEKNPPVYYERNLKNLIAVAMMNDVGVLIATWAYSDQFDDYINSDVYSQGVAEINDAMKKVGNGLGVPVYDFNSDMPRDRKYWADGRHNNEEGAYLKGQLFAKFIFENGLIGKTISM